MWIEARFVSSVNGLMKRCGEVNMVAALVASEGLFWLNTLCGVMLVKRIRSHNGY